MTILPETAAPGARSGSEHVTLPVLVEHTPWLTTADVGAVPAGRVSVNTIPVAVDDAPLLLATPNVYAIGWPTSTGSASSAIVTTRSGATTVEVTDAVVSPLVASASFIDTVAESFTE